MIILFFASYPTLPIGYSRIANILSNYLAEQNHNVYYLGISNFNTNNVERYIHPNIKIIDALLEEKKNNSNELYGVNVICDLIEEIKPDFLFLYNDIIVISRIFNNFIKRNIKRDFKVFTYLDLVYEYEKIELVNHVNIFSDLIIVFSDCWKDNLMNMGISENKIYILPHGFDTNIFYPVDKMVSRKNFDFNEDDFIIINNNRNSYRKCIDKTIDAFIKFLKIKNYDPKIKLFLNMNFEGDYDILNQIKISCLTNKIDYESVINNIYKNKLSGSISDEMLNYLYNSCDIGINTCIGEGFGLCNLEQGGIGKPQIVSGVGGLCDIFTNNYATIIKPVCELYIPNNIDFHGGYVKLCSTDDFVNAFIKYYDNRNLIEVHGKLSRETIINKYNWFEILSNFLDLFKNVKLDLGLCQGYMGLQYHMEEALVEKNLNIKHSNWSPPLAIFSKKYYNEIDSLDNNKIYDFCFIGSIKSCYERRKWVIDFVKKYFTSKSIYINTDNDCELLGIFDYSNKDLGYCPKEQDNNQSRKVQYRIIKENLFYFQTMKQSKFVLCPAGDEPWSFRFYEVLICKSIPIVESKHHTYRTKEEATINYKYIVAYNIEKKILNDNEFINNINENTLLFEKYHILN